MEKLENNYEHNPLEFKYGENRFKKDLKYIDENIDDDVPNNLPTFNVKDMINEKKGLFDAAVIVYGPRRTGKSTLGLDILLQLQEAKAIGRIALITSTEMNHFFRGYIPMCTTYDVNNAGEAINEILNFQEWLIDDDIQKVDDGILKQYTVILEDFSWDRSFAVYDKLFAKLFVTGRHFQTGVIIFIQNPTGAMNWVRNNADFAFILKTPGFAPKERIWSDQLDFMPKREAFKFMEDHTLDYNSIVVKRTDPHLPTNKTVYHFKAELIEIDNVDDRIRIGDPKWREKTDIRDMEIKTKKNKKKNRGKEFDFYSINNAFKTGGGINTIGFKQYINTLN